MNLFLIKLDLILVGIVLALCAVLYHQEKTTTTTVILILAIVSALKSLFIGIF